MNQNENISDINRRDFLRGSSIATLMMMMGAIELRAGEASKVESKTAADKAAGPPVKCALVGCGMWGREILKTLARLTNASVVAMCDTYEPFLRRAGEAAPQAEKTGDYRQLLDRKEVQAVIVATPSPLHRRIAMEALQAGKHVYCEAPLATTIEDAAAIAKAAQAAPKQIFQTGLLLRSNPIHKHVLDFVRTGALGKNALARAQWHKKQSWRRASANPEREKAANWHLSKETSLGLVGEMGIHHLDTATWFFKQRPVAVSGFGSLLVWNDGRDVADTVQAVVEFPNQLRLIYDATLVNSFEGNYEVYYGSDGAIIIRDSRAWLIKETDAPLLGWEVYARKEEFVPGKETGLALVANSTKLLAQGKEPAEAAAESETPLFYALEELIGNINESTVPSSGALAGFEVTVMAIKANEAINKGEKLALKKEWFDI